MPECSLVPKSIPCFLTFCSTIESKNPYLLFKFLIFYHSSSFAFYTFNNLSAGAQNVTGAYIIIMCLHNNYVRLQALVNNTLTW